MQSLRVARTDRVYREQEYKQSSKLDYPSGDDGEKPESAQTTLTQTSTCFLGLSPCAVPALTACTHQAERYISGVVDTRYKPAAKLVLVTNPGKAVISFCGVSMNLRPQRKWRTWSCEQGAFRQGMRLCEWLL